MQPNVKVKLLNGLAKAPEYLKSGDAGADLYATTKLSLAPGTSGMVKTGLAIELPKGYEAQIRPRSGLAYKQQITVLNTPGTIDEGYRGEIGVILINHSDGYKHIEIGDRIAQMVIKPVKQATFEIVDELGITDRGEGGFGSTGVNETPAPKAEPSNIIEETLAAAEANNALYDMVGSVYAHKFTRTHLKADRKQSKDMTLGIGCVREGMIEHILLERVAGALELFYYPDDKKALDEEHIENVIRATLNHFDTNGNLNVIPIDEETVVNVLKDGTLSVESLIKDVEDLKPDEYPDKVTCNGEEYEKVGEVEPDVGLGEGGISVLKVDEETGEATPTGAKIEADIQPDEEAEKLMEEAVTEPAEPVEDEPSLEEQVAELLIDNEYVIELTARKGRPFSTIMSAREKIENVDESLDAQGIADLVIEDVKEAIADHIKEQAIKAVLSSDALKKYCEVRAEEFFLDKAVDEAYDMLVVAGHQPTEHSIANALEKSLEDMVEETLKQQAEEAKAMADLIKDAEPEEIKAVVDNCEEIAELVNDLEEAPEIVTSTGVPQAPSLEEITAEHNPDPDIGGFTNEEIKELVDKYGDIIRKSISVYCNDVVNMSKYDKFLTVIDEELFIAMIAQEIALKDKPGENVIVVNLISDAVDAAMND